MDSTNTKRVPTKLRRMVADAEKFDETKWRTVTTDWNDLHRMMARSLRDMGEENRRKFGSDDFAELLKKGNGMEVLIALVFLSDKALDRLLRSFIH